MANASLRAPCPSCGRALTYTPANPWRPFCSASCRGHDLNAWASERFRVTASDEALSGAVRPGLAGQIDPTEAD